MLEALLAALARHIGLETALDADEDAFLERAVRATTPARSLRATLAAIHQLAFSLRDQISLDTWRVLSELQQDLADPDAPVPHAARGERDPEPHDRAALGLERARDGEHDAHARLALRRHGAPDRARRLDGDTARCLPGQAHEDEAPRLEALLEVAESAITYRRRYGGELQAVPALDLLLTDETNPRSLAFQLVALDEHVAHLPGERARVARAARSASRSAR